MTRTTGVLLVTIVLTGAVLGHAPRLAAAGGAVAPVIQDPNAPAGQTGDPAGQQAGQRGGRGRGPLRGGPLPNPQTAGPAVIDQLFDAYMIVQAQSALNLTEDQYISFMQKARLLQNIRRRVQRQRQQALAGLRETLRGQGPLDDAAVNDKLRAYDDLLMQTSPELRDAYAAVDQVLKPRQRLQFRVFEEAMERKKLELIAAARQRQPAGGTQTPAPAPIKK